jgi:anti-anti-sigma regulatory factor
MKLMIASEDKDLLLAACEGRISQGDFEPGSDPMESILGPAGFKRNVLLNLEKTNYIDSSGIGWLVICHRHFVGAGGKLVLHSVPPRVFQVLELIGLPKVMSIAHDETAARSMALGDKQ